MTVAGGVIRRLREHGPMTAAELDVDGGIRPYIREQGVARLRASAQMRGRTRPNAVYYLLGEHEYVDVVEKWLEVNLERFEGKGRRAVKDVLKPPRGDHAVIEEAIDRVVERTGFQFARKEATEAQKTQSGATKVERCSLCGEAVGKSLAAHLPDCEG